MSASSETKVFIFGGNGHLGQSIVSAITNTAHGKHFEVTAVIRKDTLESKDEKKAAGVQKLKSLGVKIVEGDSDKAPVEEIAKWISGQDIVLSTLSSFTPGPHPDLKLVEAVKLAKVSWFIPSSYGVDVSKVETDAIPLIPAKRAVNDAIVAAGINSIFIDNGAFLEYAISPFFGVDIANATITAPYSFESRFSTVKVDEIGVLVAELLLHRNEPHVKNQTVLLAADTLSYEDVHKLLEERFKKPFKKIVATKEELLEIVKNDAKFEKIGQRFQVLFGEQKGIYWNESWNSKHAKHIKLTTVKDYLAQLP